MRGMLGAMVVVTVVGCGPVAPLVTCDASNCSGCCTSSGVCLGGTAATSCGAGGNLCDACLSTQTCTAGRCVAGNAGCTANADCSLTTDICYAGSCSSGFGRTYTLTLVSANAPSNDNGIAWDIGGGAPDLKACVSVDGASVGCTSEVSDVFTATWNTNFNVTVTSNTQIVVSLFDIDTTSDDFIESFEWRTGETFISDARQGGFSGAAFSGAKTSWTVRIAPL